LSNPLGHFMQRSIVAGSFGILNLGGVDYSLNPFNSYNELLHVRDLSAA
jgi:hypothetical protein